LSTAFRRELLKHCFVIAQQINAHAQVISTLSLPHSLVMTEFRSYLQIVALLTMRYFKMTNPNENIQRNQSSDQKPGQQQGDQRMPGQQQQGGGQQKPGQQQGGGQQKPGQQQQEPGKGGQQGGQKGG
jgi:hypothetical protein